MTNYLMVKMTADEWGFIAGMLHGTVERNQRTIEKETELGRPGSVTVFECRGYIRETTETLDRINDRIIDQMEK